MLKGRVPCKEDTRLAGALAIKEELCVIGRDASLREFGLLRGCVGVVAG